MPSMRGLLWLTLFASALMLLGFGLLVGLDISYVTETDGGYTSTYLKNFGGLVAGIVIIFLAWLVQLYLGLALWAQKSRHPHHEGLLAIDAVSTCLGGLIAVTPIATIFLLFVIRRDV